MEKRLLASLMALCLLVGLFPTAAMATEGDLGTGAQTPQCVCETRCTDEDPNMECLVCAENPSACKGTTTEAEEPVCAALHGCADGAHDEACPLYTAHEEDIPSGEPSVAEQLQARIDALPAPEELAEMELDAQDAVYAEVSAIYDAIAALTEEEAAVFRRGRNDFK